MKKFSRTIIFANVMFALLFSSSLMNEVRADSQKEGKNAYRVLYSAEISTLNYLEASVYDEYMIAANVIDSLVEYDAYGNVLPCLAESWEYNEDRTQWTFHIRKGVKWIDNSGQEKAEVTAHDWVTTAHYVNDAAHGSENQYIYNTGAVVKKARDYFDYTNYMLVSENGSLTKDSEGNDIEKVPEILPEEIGVEAADDYTLVYTLESPCPFFLSLLSFSAYLPSYGPFVEECGEDFGMDAEHLLYCGAYVISEYEPQERRVLTKNETYWDKENIFIDEIRFTYNAEATAISLDMYRQGAVDYAQVSTDILEAVLEDEMGDQVHNLRVDSSYSFFYCFNFDPRFDEEYEPENWELAVNNESFRKSIQYGLDKVREISAQDPYYPEEILNNTITPVDFVAAGGKDYTQYEPLKEYTMGESFDEEAALFCKAQAMEELTKAGAVFPVKILMPYNNSTPNWAKECQIVEQQLENLLGTDYIDVITVAGPESGFLSATRRCGNYGLLLCNWGADYADPKTWTEPFSAGSDYNFWDQSTNKNIVALFEDYSKLTAQASEIYDNDEMRYGLFAEAEAMLIEHSIVIPLRVARQDTCYVVDDLNAYEGEYVPFGHASYKYKFKKLYDSSMSMEEFAKAREEWETAREKALEERNKE